MKSTLLIAVALSVVTAIPAALGHSAPTGESASMLTRGVITINQGDSLFLKDAVRTDTVLSASPGVIVGRSCGNSFAYRRVRNGRVGQWIVADSFPVHVIHCSVETPIPPVQLASVASVTVCLGADAAAYGMAHASADTSLDPVQVPCLNIGTTATGTTLQAYAIARDSLGRVLTGRHVNWDVINEIPVQSPGSGMMQFQLSPTQARQAIRRAN